MPPEQPCPIRDQPPTRGGAIVASVGEQAAALFEFRYTPEQGTGDSDAPCAFLALSYQALAHQLAQQELDRTQACRCCARVVRVHSLHQPSA